MVPMNIGKSTRIANMDQCITIHSGYDAIFGVGYLCYCIVVEYVN